MPTPSATIRLGAPHPYLVTHGTKVARLHLFDWIVLALLVAIEVGLNLIEPFHRFVGEDMMTDLRYPMKDNTVPVWAVPIYAVIGPIIIFIAIYMKRRNVYDLHHAILGLLFSVLITGVLTDAIKDGVGRPRPNFFWRCFPDGVGNYDNITRGVICHGDPSVIKEGHKSFPKFPAVTRYLPCCPIPGSFAGLGFLSWYLAGKIKAFDRGGHIAKLCIVILPLLLAAMVAVSRVDDYWHHWQDVFAGGILGRFGSCFVLLPAVFPTTIW
ncbi:hypothetical protein EJB05_36574 [Eragrostis curvula]|uniref:Phosphatidic acid phosphatase type 2/haloperoxidase domain-containing protein n=1 Tax=Eragrostis curvula TaxID=38414 RepID=A0A5J9UAK1_9POAL|nr:hypothetical protein EJB05_36574 [Eragrostis curvula]